MAKTNAKVAKERPRGHRGCHLRLGNASRNPVRGAPYRELDMALVKDTALSEKTYLEFRAEVFDLTNTPALAQPSGSVGAAALGTINATTTDPRVVQFGLRLSR